MNDDDNTKSKKVNKAWLQRPRQRPLREAGAARGLPRPRRLQAQGDRRDAGPDQAGPAGRRPGRRAGRLEPVRAAQVRAQSAGAAARRSARSTARIIALDMLPIEPIEGVHFIQGDFREAEVLAELERAPGRAGTVDVVVSDMAPNLSGIESADAARMAAPGRTGGRVRRCSHLKPEGALVCKVFHGSGYSQLVEAVQDRPSGWSSRSSPRPRATNRRKPFWSASV